MTMCMTISMIMFTHMSVTGMAIISYGICVIRLIRSMIVTMMCIRMRILIACTTLSF